MKKAAPSLFSPNVLFKSNFGLNDNNLDALIKELQQKPGVTKLVVSGNNLTGTGLAKLIQALPTNIVALDASDNNITDTDVDRLDGPLVNSMLTELNLSDNKTLSNKSLPTIQKWQTQYRIEVKVYRTNIATQESNGDQYESPKAPVNSPKSDADKLATLRARATILAAQPNEDKPVETEVPCMSFNSPSKSFSP